MSRATVPSSMDRWKSKNEQQPVSSTARAAARAATSRSGRRSSRVLVADSGTRPRRRLRRAHRTPCDALAARLLEACTPSGPSCRRPSGWPSLRSRFDGKPGPRYGMQLHHAYGYQEAGGRQATMVHAPTARRPWGTRDQGRVVDVPLRRALSAARAPARWSPRRYGNSAGSSRAHFYRLIQP